MHNYYQRHNFNTEIRNMNKWSVRANISQAKWQRKQCLMVLSICIFCRAYTAALPPPVQLQLILTIMLSLYNSSLLQSVGNEDTRANFTRQRRRASSFSDRHSMEIEMACSVYCAIPIGRRQLIPAIQASLIAVCGLTPHAALFH